MIKKIQTGCCALAQLSISNDTSLEDIKVRIDKMKRIADKTDFDPSVTGIGERAVFVITTPDESNLCHNLIKLGFKQQAEFKRRKGYPQTGNLLMWMLSW